ncbi:hypothetical protein [Dubosiella newyorkensis]|nr:hypothetical protein [Dubosiella newyorkensis]
MAVNCFRFFGYNTMKQALDLDMHEYRLLCEAQALKNVDLDYRIHELAYASNKASLRDKKGRLIYAKFTKLYDYERALDRLKKKQTKKKEMSPQLEAYKRFLAQKNKGGDGS